MNPQRAFCLHRKHYQCSPILMGSIIFKFLLHCCKYNLFMKVIKELFFGVDLIVRAYLTRLWVQWALQIKKAGFYSTVSVNTLSSSNIPSKTSPVTTSPTPSGVPVYIISPMFNVKYLEILAKMLSKL